ncbi:hypothetical protein BGX20_002663 [Mortierella sp. AD010]|nr:hypothetical protein BGX20_002663 [Mortierella sp. AD010]
MGNFFSSHQSVKEEGEEWTAIRHQHQDKAPTIHHTHPQNTQQTVYHVPIQRSKIPFTQLVEEQRQEQQQHQKANTVSQSPGRRKRGRKGRGDLYEDDFHAGHSKKEIHEKCLERQATFQAKYLKAAETSKRLERSAK